MSEIVKEYWNTRASENSTTSQATTNDVHLRRLELTAFVKTLRSLQLPENARILDIGCGDGRTTLGIASEFPRYAFLGVDYSEKMIGLASEQLSRESDGLRSRVTFRCGDATALNDTIGNDCFDVIITDRCLINLASKESQYAALASFAEHIRPGGYYIGIENFMEGQDSLNAARTSVGLPPIAVRWHNLFFVESEFRRGTSRLFENVLIDDFSSSYYFATRVIYSEMCRLQGVEPDYDHDIHKLATKLPSFGSFSPIKMIVARRSAEARVNISAIDSTPMSSEVSHWTLELSRNANLRQSSIEWLTAVSRYRYCYNFTWMGRPIIQFPQDIVAIQEIVWRTKPDLIVETGIAHGGSLVLSASCLELLGGSGRVLGIDNEIRGHNRSAIESHPLAKRIHMIEGSSTDESVFARVRDFCDSSQRIMVILDSNHTHDHVCKELSLYSELVTKGCYLVVMDTIIDDLPADFFPGRPWTKSANPKSAVKEFLSSNTRFVVDDQLEAKLQATVAPHGYLYCLED